jgi:two-component system, chemotaxis family, protein-glutamate methylesterase/glutaminase
LPRDFPAAVVVALHVPSSGTSALPAILRRAGALPAAHAADEQALVAGRIVVAPPDHHLVVYDGHVTLSRGPRENGQRPAVDVTFRSAARAHGPRTIGVVLSGSLDDGAAGLVAISLRGGVGVAQDPDDALHPGMPQNAIEAARPEHVLPVAKIPSLLTGLVTETTPDRGPEDTAATRLMEVETAMAKMDAQAIDNAPEAFLEPAGFSCPDCNGALYVVREGGLQRYRCHVGHAWSAKSLLAQQSTSTETALWIALRTLEEKAALSQEMRTQADERGHRHSAARFAEDARESTHAAGLVRDLIEQISSETTTLTDEVFDGIDSTRDEAEQAE